MRRRRFVISLTAITALLTAPGCYREVTSAKGVVAEQRYPRRADPSKPKLDQALDPILDPLLGDDD